MSIRPRPPKFDMPLRAVLERIAFHSRWAATRDFNSPADHWQKTMWEVPLGKELLHPLASGDIPSRGIRSGEDGDEHGLSDIPPEFWRNPKLKPHADRLLLEEGYDYVGQFGVPPTYHDVWLRSVDVERIWPVRKREEIEVEPSPFAAWAEEWKGAYEDRLINSQMEIEENLARLMHKARRRLIAKGRDAVERFRAERPSEPFETWARRQREYLDVQPHLGDEYQKWVIRNAERDVSAIADGKFLRELSRLEKLWGLI